jgi:phenylalanyl-tRNA synthetase beta subunit
MRERRSRITQVLHPGYEAAISVDTLLQIGVFGKLKLMNCARLGNRAGFFACALIRRVG